MRLLPWLLLSALSHAADTYDIHYHARFLPDQGFAEASMTVTQASGELEWLDFSAPVGRNFDFQGDGTIERHGERVRWTVPSAGGRLDYRVRVDRQRGERYDARMTESWAIMRLDHLFPSARVSTREREVSRPSLSLEGPKDWRFETRYGSVNERIELPPANRRFVRPTGWLAAGELSIRRDRIAGRRVVITGPLEERLRSQDFMALLRWNLPELVKLLPHFPERLLIVNAGDPMWRGGLSGPGSLYLHAERPLISGDGSSTPLHELVHVGTASEAEPGNDWIVEGLAEFYSIEILRRSRTISESRHRRTLQNLAARADRSDGKLKSPSTGAHTSRAVVVFHDLHHELLRAKVKGGLDAVATPLLDGPPLSEQRLLELTEQALGRPSKVLTEALEKYRP
jgi:hypothetical protein